MSKKIKIILCIICGLILLFLVDILSIFVFNKPIFAIKEDNGDSTNRIYRGVFYDTYNCLEYSVPQIKSKKSKFTCAVESIKTDDYDDSDFNPTEIENVNVYIADLSAKGATLIIRDTNDEPYTYGDWYKLEKYVDGKWVDVEPLVDDYFFNEMGYVPNENDEVRFTMNWEKIYGELPLGSYRILKQANNEIFSIEFGVAVTS